MGKKKNTKHIFSKYKMHFFSFKPFWLSKFISFSFLDLKCHGSATLCSTNHLGTLKAMEQFPKIVFNVHEKASKCYNIFYFYPPYFGSHNFLISYPFVNIFSVSDVPIWFIFGCHKKIRSSLDFVKLWTNKWLFTSRYTLAHN